MVLKSRIFRYTIKTGIDGQEERLNNFLKTKMQEHIVTIHMTNDLHILVVYHDNGLNDNDRNVGFEST